MRLSNLNRWLTNFSGVSLPWGDTIDAATRIPTFHIDVFRHLPSFRRVPHLPLQRTSQGTASVGCPGRGFGSGLWRPDEVRAAGRRGDGAATPLAVAAPAPRPPPAPAARRAGRRTTTLRQAGGCRSPSGTAPAPADRSAG